MAQGPGYERQWTVFCGEAASPRHGCSGTGLAGGAGMTAAECWWFERRQLEPGILLLCEPFVHEDFRANLYRIAGKGFDIQLDFGTGLCSLGAAVQKPKRPVLAVATHAHIDHIGSFHEFPRRAGHPAEAVTFATMCDEGTLCSRFTTLSQPVACRPAGVGPISTFVPPPAPLTEILDEGDVLDLGGRSLRVLHLPGHSPGSIGLLDERDGVLFAGDAIYDDELLDDIPGADIPDYLATMRRLAELDVRIVYGGHGQPFDGMRMRQIARDYIRTREHALPARLAGRPSASAATMPVVR
jgi:glyoxylase-like metal-dependent hydrolase (beta-lactamase superfamily II)